MYLVQSRYTKYHNTRNIWTRKQRSRLHKRIDHQKLFPFGHGKCNILWIVKKMVGGILRCAYQKVGKHFFLEILWQIIFCDYFSCDKTHSCLIKWTHGPCLQNGNFEYVCREKNCNRFSIYLLSCIQLRVVVTKINKNTLALVSTKREQEHSRGVVSKMPPSSIMFVSLLSWWNRTGH